MFKFVSFVLTACFCTTGQTSENALTPIEAYDWSRHFKVTTPHTLERGNQVLHSKPRNKHYTASPASIEFVTTYLTTAQQMRSDADVLRYGSDNAPKEGAIIEAGVGFGRTINFIAALNPENTIYGFDSFEGLPDAWDKGDGRIIEQGTFALKDPSFKPAVLNNVVIYPGEFSKVLPAFKSQILQDKPISLLHIDCDIYSSTRDVLEALGDNIVPGTIMVFDELYNYPNYAAHEWKALQEFKSQRNLSLEFIAYNINHEQVAIRVKGES